MSLYNIDENKNMILDALFAPYDYDTNYNFQNDPVNLNVGEWIDGYCNFDMGGRLLINTLKHDLMIIKFAHNWTTYSGTFISASPEGVSCIYFTREYGLYPYYEFNNGNNAAKITFYTIGYYRIVRLS